MPTQLTLNRLRDQYASYLPDGSAILYTFEANGAHNFDRCLALLPPNGGTRRELCSTSAGQVDSTEVFGPSSASAGGRLAYGYAQSTPGRPVPNYRALRVADLADPQDFELVHPIPFTIDGFKIDTVKRIHWLTEQQAVYLGVYDILNSVLTDRIAVLIDLGPPITLSVIPGTESITDLTVGPDPNAIIITRPGDSRILEFSLVSGQETVLYDFTPGQPGDIDASGDHLVTVRDSSIIVVDLASMTVDTVVGQAGTPLLSGPTISPSGSVVTHGAQDLWLFGAPSQ